MCTLIIGQDVIAPGTVILAGNRDENPTRPSRGPGVLIERPRVVGGADAVAGGTWMAIRERRAAVAMLNRWRGDAPAPPADGLRSRGRLALDLAGGTPPGKADSGARGRILSLVAGAHYAPFNAVYASPSGSWAYSHRGEGVADPFTSIEAGWHVITHRDMDDPGEPRAASLGRLLADWRPAHPAEARDRLVRLLASHRPPRVCIHAGPMVTVSSFVVWLTRDEACYHHLDGRPCEHALEDFTHLLDGRLDSGGSA